MEKQISNKGVTLEIKISLCPMDRTYTTGGWSKVYQHRSWTLWEIAAFYSLCTSMSHRPFFNIWKAGWEPSCTLCPMKYCKRQKPAFPFIVQSQAGGMTRPASVTLLQQIKTKSPALPKQAVHQICVNLRTGYTEILFACKALLWPGGVSKCIHGFAHSCVLHFRAVC